MANFRKMIFLSNWKIYMRSRAEVVRYITKVKKNLKSYNTETLDVYIFPDFMSFEVVKNNLKDIPIYVGVQDIFWEDYGSFAGEVAQIMLKDLGCDCVYMGHSERKMYFGETDENINKKVLTSLRNGITPFLFVGETKEELDKGVIEDVIRNQLKIGLKGVPVDLVKSIVIIYEPSWAIGREDAASPKIIDKRHKKVRKLIAELYNSDTASLIRILYGGSVNSDNISAIIKIPDVDGTGSTRSSLDPINFIKMVRMVEKESEYRKSSFS